jgi:hypothetical protein
MDTFLTLGTELRRFGRYPDSETNPLLIADEANVVGDVIAEFRRDGVIINQWSLLDILDPYRIGFNALGSTWNAVYNDIAAGTRDWSHANAVVHDPSDDSLIVSVRHQDAVIKMDRGTGRLIWILGDPQGWGPAWRRYLLFPEGRVIWPYHQHAPEVTPNGTLLLFDNGNQRRRPFDSRPDESYSRVVEYAVDEKRMTVSEVWSFGWPEGERFFSNALGDADWLPGTGNILATDGSRLTEFPRRVRFARIVELTRTKPAEKVFELIVRDAARTGSGWQVYRSERILLYPG